MNALFKYIGFFLFLSTAAAGLNLFTTDYEDGLHNKNWFFTNFTLHLNSSLNCQQEFFTLDYSCGAISGGNNISTGSYNSYPNNWKDGTYWSAGYSCTEFWGTGVNSSILINYTKPETASSANWLVNYYTSSSNNVSLDLSDCFSADPNVIMLYWNGSHTGTKQQYSCWTGSYWKNLFNTSAGDWLCEESVSWNITNKLNSFIYSRAGVNFSLYDPSLLLAYSFENFSALYESNTRVKNTAFTYLNVSNTTTTYSGTGGFGNLSLSKYAVGNPIWRDNQTTWNGTLCIPDNIGDHTGFYENGTIYMYWRTTCKVSGVDWIGIVYSTSTNGIKFNDQKSIINATGNIAYPEVFKVNNSYYMVAVVDYAGVDDVHLYNSSDKVTWADACGGTGIITTPNDNFNSGVYYNSTTGVWHMVHEHGGAGNFNLWYYNKSGNPCDAEWTNWGNIANDSAAPHLQFYNGEFILFAANDSYGINVFHGTNPRSMVMSDYRILNVNETWETSILGDPEIIKIDDGNTTFPYKFFMYYSSGYNGIPPVVVNLAFDQYNRTFEDWITGNVSSINSTTYSLMRFNGEVIGGNYSGVGKYGKAMQFDGTNDYINSTFKLDSTPLTFCYWIKGNAVATQVAFNLNNQVWAGAFTNGQYRTFGGKSCGTIGSWAHVCENVTLSAGTLYSTSYCNGQLLGAYDACGAFTLGGYLLLGGNFLGGFYLNGTLDEVRIWNRTLSASEIALQYQSNFRFNNLSSVFFSINNTGITAWNTSYYCWANDSFGVFNFSSLYTYRTNEPVSFYNCTLPNANNSFSIFIKDELTGVALTGANVSLNAILSQLDGSTATYSFSLKELAGDNASFCIMPSWGNATLSASFEVKKDGYDYRSFYYYGAISNVSTNYTAYLTEAASSEQVILHVLDQNEDAVVGVYVNIYKYDVAFANYSLIMSSLTDAEGKTTANLVIEDTKYRFIVVNSTGGELTRLDNVFIVCPQDSVCPPYDIIIRVSITAVPDVFKYLNTVSHSCAFDETSMNFTCNVSATNPTLFEYSSLVISLRNSSGFFSMCVSNGTGVNSSPSCSLGNYTGKIYSFSLYIYDSSGGAYLLESGLIDYLIRGIEWGIDGVFFALLLILILAMIGTYSPVASVLLAYLGVVVSYLLGLFTLPLGVNGGWAIIISLGGVVAVLIYKMKS